VSERVAVFAEAFLHTSNGKAAHGLIRYGEREVVAAVDSLHAGRTVVEIVPYAAKPVPIVATVAEAAALGAQCLAIGVAPAGGKLPPEWKEALLAALALGLHVEAGLHDELGNDPDLVAAAAERGLELRDLRRVPDGLDVPTGANLDVPTHTVLTVGSDCALGKMTVCLELDREARRRGVASVFVPTGQTGIAIAGWGIAVDQVVSDFVAGAAEELVVEAHARGGDGAILWIEGQGSLNHPSYSGVTLGLLHGSAPHALVFVHEPGRALIDGNPRFPIRGLAELIDDYVRLARHVRPAPVVAVALKTNRIAEDAARAAIAETERETGLVADDPVRFGAGRILDAVLSSR
jgi:uncharacterized NAD-dependent epimerase/dehydratase family protein